jgi:uncharacterized membrane protein
LVLFLTANILFEPQQETHVLHRTIIALAAAAALGCIPLATNALAAHPGHRTVGHAMHARSGHVGARYGYRGGGYYGGPIYDSCNGYDQSYAYNGCPGYGPAPFIGNVIDGVFGGYQPY